MSDDTPASGEHGPFQANQLKPGDRYELSDGHPIYCTPTGGDGARGGVVGAELLDTDPDVDEAGIDAGFTTAPGMLRAPDISVGNVPDKQGWIPGVPLLAVEYASDGQDERDLQNKIGELLKAGTRHIWVVRLVGPRRVEVYEPGRAVRVAGPGEELVAPGILRNKVPVEGLYDRSLAHELTLRNLLQRRGYGGLEEIREEGQRTALRRAIREILSARGIPIDGVAAERIEACADVDTLSGWLRKAATLTSSAEVFG